MQESGKCIRYKIFFNTLKKTTNSMNAYIGNIKQKTRMFFLLRDIQLRVVDLYNLV